MKHIHILTPGFTGANGSAFLYPFIRNRAALLAEGIRISLVDRLPNDVTACALVIVDSKYYRKWPIADRPVLLAQLAHLSSQTRLWWFDTTDSTGTLQSDVIDSVDRYYKSQLLRDRSLYQTDLYGDRLASDYYHASAGVSDGEPTRVGPVLEAHQIPKLHVSWNSGLADYSHWGLLLRRLYHKTRLKRLLRAPARWVSPDSPRPLSVSSRFGVSGRKPTLRYQRDRINALLGERKTPTSKISRGKFLEELRKSFVVISPFGYGEITLRDFEVFINGAVLMKPDMSHLDTWPPLYRNGETYLSVRWDLEDLNETIDWALAHPAEAREVAAEGQRNYKSYVADAWGGREFVRRFAAMTASLDG